MCVRVKRQSLHGSLHPRARFAPAAQDQNLRGRRLRPYFTRVAITLMAILNILEFPDPRLRTIAKPVAVVDDEVRQLVDDMFETMYEAPGIGLAATQVNVHKRVVVMDLSEDRSEPRVFINPEFEALTDEMDQYQEGCLSVPGFYENVESATGQDQGPGPRRPALRTDRRRFARRVHPARMRPPERQVVRRLPVHAQA